MSKVGIFLNGQLMVSYPNHIGAYGEILEDLKEAIHQTGTLHELKLMQETPVREEPTKTNRIVFRNGSVIESTGQPNNNIRGVTADYMWCLKNKAEEYEEGSGISVVEDEHE